MEGEKNIDKKNLFEKYKTASKLIERVKINSNDLRVFWQDGKEEVFHFEDLTKITIITTDDGPFEPDVFWLLIFKIPVLVPNDELVPGSLAIKDILLDLPGFEYEKFIQAMTSTDNNVYELWEN